ncbi:MAG: hypothetical protein ACRCYU_18665 [Nocardioides sp.]
MTRQVMNVRLKAARQHAGFASQQALADALNRAAPRLGLGPVEISARQVRRWESASPPWPRADYQKLLQRVLNSTVEELGFTPPWAVDGATATHSPRPRSSAEPLPVVTSGDMVQPPTVSSDYATITSSYRRLYATVTPAHLHDALQEHTRMGSCLLAETGGVSQQIVAAALAEALLLLGRIEFFDLQSPNEADHTYVLALQAAGQADDALLGSAILAHAAFVPGWASNREEAAERMCAARVYARRGPASVEFLAWLDAVEAECETISGDFEEALRLLNHAEDTLAGGNEHEPPDWFTWFTPVRLAAFKGNTQLKAGQLPQARETLQQALAASPPSDDKQTTVILGDLAAVEAATGNPETACDYAERALDQLARTWYSTGMERVKEATRALQQYADLECVRRVDDRLYGWQTTVRSLQHRAQRSS